MQLKPHIYSIQSNTLYTCTSNTVCRLASARCTHSYTISDVLSCTLARHELFWLRSGCSPICPRGLRRRVPPSRGAGGAWPPPVCRAVTLQAPSAPCHVVCLVHGACSGTANGGRVSVTVGSGIIHDGGIFIAGAPQRGLRARRFRSRAAGSVSCRGSPLHTRCRLHTPPFI